MESGQYLRSVGRRGWLIVIIPLLAAGIAFAVTSSRSEEHRSSSLVLTHPDISQFGSNVGYVTAFQAALTTDEVLKSVSAATGISVTDLQAGLSAEPSASNSLTFKVDYQGTQSSAQTLQATQVASRAVITELSGPQLEGAQSAVTQADATAKAASAALSAFSQRTGLYSPSQDYQALKGQMSQLRVLLVQTQATLGTPTYSTQSIQAAIGAAHHKLVQLAPQLGVFDGLQATAAAAQSAQQSAAAELTAAKNAATLSASDGSVLTGSTTSVSSTGDAARAAGAAALAGLIVAALWVGLFGGRSGRQAEGRSESEARDTGLDEGESEVPDEGLDEGLGSDRDVEQELVSRHSTGRRSTSERA